jgi:hypothetical protein
MVGSSLHKRQEIREARKKSVSNIRLAILQTGTTSRERGMPHLSRDLRHRSIIRHRAFGNLFSILRAAALPYGGRVKVQAVATRDSEP